MQTAYSRIAPSWQPESQKDISPTEVIILAIILGQFAAIIIPNLLRSRQASNEASAISSVRTIGTAQATYQSTRGRGRHFAPSLADLAMDGMVDAALGSGRKNGFIFISTGYSAIYDSPSTFETVGVPDSTGVFGTGNRSFYSNETFVIYQRPGKHISDWGVVQRTPSAPASVLD